MTENDRQEAYTERGLAPSVEAIADHLPREMYVYQLGVQRIYVRDAAETGVEVYKRAGETNDPEEMADHDGPVLFGGKFRHMGRDDHGGITAYHPYGGRMEHISGRPDAGAVLLTEVDRLV